MLMLGMMLLNLKKMREDNITDKCLEFIKQYKGSVPHHDQGTINAICNQRILVIHPKYNVQSPMYTYTADKIKKMHKIEQYYSQEEIDEAISKPVFIHYTDGFFGRPWNRDCTHPKKELYLKYMEQSYWNGKIDDAKLNKNVVLMRKLYNYLPFKFYCVLTRIISKRKEKRIQNKYENIRRK